MLHIVNKSPFERNSFDSCLRLAKSGSAILLIEDGVYAATTGTAVADKVAARASDFSFYAMGPDLQARGIEEDKISDAVTVVDYAGFVDLAVDHSSSTSWL